MSRMINVLNMFEDIWQVLENGIMRLWYVIYFGAVKALAWVLDLLTQLFYIFSGMTPIGTKTINTENGIDEGVDILNFFLTQKEFTKAYGLLCLAALGLIVVFTIGKIIKQDYFERSGPRSKAPIFRSVALSFIAFICVIPVFMFLMQASGALALLVMRALGYSGGGVGSLLFSISWDTVSYAEMDGSVSYYSGYDIFTQFSQSLPNSKIFDPDSFGWHDGTAFREFFWDSGNMQKQTTVDYVTATGEITLSVPTFYWYVFFGAGIAVLGSLAVMLIGMVARIFKLISLFIIAPSPISQIVLDDGQKFKTWKDQVLKEALKVVGSVMSFMIFMLIAVAVPEIDLMKFAYTQNSASYINLLGGQEGTIQLSNTISSLYYGVNGPSFVDHAANSLGQGIIMIAGVGAIKDIDSVLSPVLSGDKTSLDMGATGAQVASSASALAKGATAAGSKAFGMATALADKTVGAGVRGLAGLFKKKKKDGAGADEKGEDTKTLDKARDKDDKASDEKSTETPTNLDKDDDKDKNTETPTDLDRDDDKDKNSEEDKAVSVEEATKNLEDAEKEKSDIEKDTSLSAEEKSEKLKAADEKIENCKKEKEKAEAIKKHKENKEKTSESRDKMFEAKNKLEAAKRNEKELTNIKTAKREITNKMNSNKGSLKPEEEEKMKDQLKALNEREKKLKENIDKNGNVKSCQNDLTAAEAELANNAEEERESREKAKELGLTDKDLGEGPIEGVTEKPEKNDNLIDDSDGEKTVTADKVSTGGDSTKTDGNSTSGSSTTTSGNSTASGSSTASGNSGKTSGGLPSDYKRSAKRKFGQFQMNVTKGVRKGIVKAPGKVLSIGTGLARTGLGIASTTLSTVFSMAGLKAMAGIVDQTDSAIRKSYKNWSEKKLGVKKDKNGNPVRDKNGNLKYNSNLAWALDSGNRRADSLDEKYKMKEKRKDLKDYERQQRKQEVRETEKEEVEAPVKKGKKEVPVGDDPIKVEAPVKKGKKEDRLERSIRTKDREVAQQEKELQQEVLHGDYQTIKDTVGKLGSDAGKGEFTDEQVLDMASDVEEGAIAQVETASELSGDGGFKLIGKGDKEVTDFAQKQAVKRDDLRKIFADDSFDGKGINHHTTGNGNYTREGIKVKNGLMDLYRKAENPKEKLKYAEEYMKYKQYGELPQMDSEVRAKVQASEGYNNAFNDYSGVYMYAGGEARQPFLDKVNRVLDEEEKFENELKKDGSIVLGRQQVATEELGKEKEKLLTAVKEGNIDGAVSAREEIAKQMSTIKETSGIIDGEMNGIYAGKEKRNQEAEKKKNHQEKIEKDYNEKGYSTKIQDAHSQLDEIGGTGVDVKGLKTQLTTISSSIETRKKQGKPMSSNDIKAYNQVKQKIANHNDVSSQIGNLEKLQSKLTPLTGKGVKTGKIQSRIEKLNEQLGGKVGKFEGLSKKEKKEVQSIQDDIEYLITQQSVKEKQTAGIKEQEAKKQVEQEAEKRKHDTQVDDMREKMGLGKRKRVVKVTIPDYNEKEIDSYKNENVVEEKLFDAYKSGHIKLDDRLFKQSVTDMKIEPTITKVQIDDALKNIDLNKVPGDYRSQKVYSNVIQERYKEHSQEYETQVKQAKQFVEDFGKNGDAELLAKAKEAVAKAVGASIKLDEIKIELEKGKKD